MGMSFAEYMAAAQAAEKSGMSGKDFVKQQRQAQVKKEASQTFNYGIRNTNTYRPPAPPPQQPQAQPQQQQQAPAVVTQQSQPQQSTQTSTPTSTTTSTPTSTTTSTPTSTTPTVDPYAEAQKRFDQQLADMRTEFSDRAAAQERSMQMMISQYQAAQQEAIAAAERQRRQMQIAQAYGQSDPADVRFSRSRAQRAGMVSAGATGAFGRRGLRIRNLNIPTGQKAAMNNTAGSFA